MWAGPHHLHYTALPDWAQSLGMVFSLILLAPSWGGAINGVMTLSGVWHKLRTDPIIKFLIVALSFYMIATFEGPMMSIKTVNSLSHYTDWTVGHVHAGALGWVAMITHRFDLRHAAAPARGTQMWSTRLIDTHFWVHTIGVVFYIASMWIAGVMQGLMWRATNADGTLTYTFVESLAATYPYYLIRLLGGVLVLAGMIVMAWNVWQTWRIARARRRYAGACPRRRRARLRTDHEERTCSRQGREERRPDGSPDRAVVVRRPRGDRAADVPGRNGPAAAGVKPYPPLQLAGRDIYVREGCYNCHSQMVRTLRFETERYGHYSLAGESVYDRPFQWGSKRTGPDLARVGGRYSDDWHRVHLTNPRDVVPESNMPSYPWLAEAGVDVSLTVKKVKALRSLGEPYTDAEVEGAAASLVDKTELDAVVAYLQGLGRHAPGVAPAAATSAGGTP
jgi:cytochrome c oxidase cbb3-type subunit I/II